jgi:hypothetical protein
MHAMTEPTRPNHDDPQPARPGGEGCPFDDWEPLFDDLAARFDPQADSAEEPSDDAIIRRLAAWGCIEADVAAAGVGLMVDLAVAAASRRPSMLLSVVGRLVDADPGDPAGRAVYLAAFRPALVSLSVSLGRKSGQDPASLGSGLSADLLAANHELVVFAAPCSGTAVVERTRAIAIARLLGPDASPQRVAFAALGSRVCEAIEDVVHDCCTPDLVDRVLRRFVPTAAVERLAAMVDDGVEIDVACATLRLWGFAARRQLATYRAVRPLYEAESARIAAAIVALENGDLS